MFYVVKKAYMDNFKLGFDLRYYKSYQGFSGSRSGAAIFKPENKTSERFGKLTSVVFHVSDLLSQVTLIYNDTKTNEYAAVKARVFKDSNLIEFDVTIGPLSKAQHGKEVVVVFWSPNINNKDEFFTDSNGLQMETRNVNYRPTWNFKPQSHQNISVNYYPVTSAIVIKNQVTSYQMTVMTTRTQGGTVLEAGRIELMQSRRLNYNDEYTKGVVLNEGEAVQATYFVQLFDHAHEKSEQRLHQIRYENPLQYFFAFNYILNPKDVQPYTQTLLNFTQLQACGLPEYSKVEYLPYNHSQIYFIVQNLEDSFDQYSKKDTAQVSYFNITKFAEMVFQRANNKNMTANDYHWFSEMSLSGNQGLDYMRYDKVSWIGEDDDFVEEYKFPKDKSWDVVSMEPQRIRMFYLEFFSWEGEDWGEWGNSTANSTAKLLEVLQ